MEFTKETVDGVCVCRLAGPLDLLAADDLRSRLNEIAQAGQSIAVLNLDGVAFICSAGLGALVGFRQALARAGGKVALCGLSPAIYKLFKISRLDWLFEIAASEAAALVAVRPTQ